MVRIWWWLLPTFHAGKNMCRPHLGVLNAKTEEFSGEMNFTVQRIKPILCWQFHFWWCDMLHITSFTILFIMRLTQVINHTVFYSWTLGTVWTSTSRCKDYSNHPLFSTHEYFGIVQTIPLPPSSYLGSPGFIHMTKSSRFSLLLFHTVRDHAHPAYVRLPVSNSFGEQSWNFLGLLPKSVTVRTNEIVRSVIVM